MSQPDKILIIEDDPYVTDLIEIHLKDLGYELERATDGLTGLNKVQKHDYVLVILDLMLPQMDGIEVCKRIRAENKYTPILMLTARSDEFDKVLGLELGADDYLTKPFSVRELTARIKALFRRMAADREKTDNQDKAAEQVFGELKLCLDKRKVTVSGRPVELTAKEFDLLALFATHPGHAYSRQELLNLVWGYQFDGYDHTVNSHINRLRSKIEKKPADPKFIQTVWGVGYRFAEPEELTE